MMRPSRSHPRQREPHLVEAEFAQAWPYPWHDRHLAPAATCAACRQHVCAHTDLEYQGLVRLKGHDDD